MYVRPYEPLNVMMQNSSKDHPFGQRFKLAHAMDRQKVEVLDFLTFHCNRLITVCLSRPDLNKKNSKKKKKRLLRLRECALGKDDTICLGMQ